jgi:hypothetical protein
MIRLSTPYGKIAWRPGHYVWRAIGSQEILPFTFDLDIRFIHPVGIVRRLEVRPTSFLQLWSITLDPAEDRGVIHRKALLQHYFLEIPITHSVAQITADAEQDFKLTPLERIGLAHGMVRISTIAKTALIPTHQQDLHTSVVRLGHHTRTVRSRGYLRSKKDVPVFIF